VLLCAWPTQPLGLHGVIHLLRAPATTAVMPAAIAVVISVSAVLVHTLPSSRSTRCVRSNSTTASSNSSSTDTGLKGLHIHPTCAVCMLRSWSCSSCSTLTMAAAVLPGWTPPTAAVSADDTYAAAVQQQCSTLHTTHSIHHGQLLPWWHSPMSGACCHLRGVGWNHCCLMDACRTMGQTPA
jgi:hypothetical protein